MGLCAYKRNFTDGDANSSYEDSEYSITDKSVADVLNTGKSLVVGGPGKKYPGTIGISQLVFSSDDAIKLTKPLFRKKITRYKSQATFFQKGSTFYLIPLTEVTSQLFFGSFEDAKNEQKLKDLGITHMISLIGPKNKIKGIKHMHKPMSDHGRTNLKRVMAILWPFVLESQCVDNKLFVHCQSGQNRSATVVLSILMKLKNDKLDVLYRMVKKKRPVVQINEKYARQLSEMESELFGETSVPKTWLSISSYDMESGDVEFNDEIRVESSAEETAATMSNNAHESKTIKIPEEPSPGILNISSLRDFEMSEKESLSDHATPTVKFVHEGTKL